MIIIKLSDMAVYEKTGLENLKIILQKVVNFLMILMGWYSAWKSPDE